MSEQENDNLENFFRERVNHHNLEFDERDWIELEKQLDVEMPRVSPFWLWLKKYWAFPLLILLIPTGWFSYKFYDKPSGNREVQADEIKATSKQKPILKNEMNEPSSKKLQSGTEKEIGLFKSADDHQIIQRQSDSGHLISKNSQRVFDGNNKTDHDLESEKLGYVVFKNGAQAEEGIRDYGLHFLSPITPDIEDFAVEYPEIIKTKSISEIGPKRNKRTFLSVGIGYSPDFSTVGLGNFSSPGVRWKFLAEYSISTRFSINTGAVWVNNKYETPGEDYHAPTRYWKNGIVASDAYGECKMVDIPLNIRYNFWVSDKNSLFISGGASTYFLLKEDYYFNYEMDDPDLPSYWGTEKMTVYPFGIVNFSFGYQRQFSKKSSLQIEPYIKIPTAGIGWGNVDLHTVGIYFMYRYKIGN